jgi:hypothetical protein
MNNMHMNAMMPMAIIPALSLISCDPALQPPCTQKILFMDMEAAEFARLARNLTVLASVEPGCKVGVTASGDLFLDPPALLRPLYRRLRGDTAPGTIAAVCVILQSISRCGPHSATAYDGTTLDTLLPRVLDGTGHLADTYASCGHSELADKLRQAAKVVQAAVQAVVASASQAHVCDIQDMVVVHPPSSEQAPVETSASLLALADIIVAGATDAVAAEAGTASTPAPPQEAASIAKDLFHFPPLSQSHMTIPKVLYVRHQKKPHSAAKPVAGVPLASVPLADVPSTSC